MDKLKIPARVFSRAEKLMEKVKEMHSTTANNEGAVLPNHKRLHSQQLHNMRSQTGFVGLSVMGQNEASASNHGNVCEVLLPASGNIENHLFNASVNTEDNDTKNYNLQQLPTCSLEHNEHEVILTDSDCGNISSKEDISFDDTDKDSDFICHTDCSSTSSRDCSVITKKSRLSVLFENKTQRNSGSCASRVDTTQHTHVSTGIDYTFDETSCDIFDVAEIATPMDVQECDAPGEEADLTVGRRKRSAKGEGKFCRKKRIDRKMKRNTGQEYISRTGKVVKGRASKVLKICRMQCRTKLEQVSEGKTIQQVLFDEYWSLGDRNRRVEYIAGLVESKTPKTCRRRTDNPENQKSRKFANYFHFKINGENINVCRKCFTDTLGETNMFITQVLSNSTSSTSGITCTDRRGKNPPVHKTSDNKLEEVVSHINSFPLYESHYTRRKSEKKYLPSHYSLQLLYRLYLEKYPEKPVSRSIYEREFRKMNISFKHPKVDTCHRCDVLNLQKKMVTDSEKLKGIEYDISTHHEAADAAYLSKSNEKDNAKRDKSLRCYCFDLQQCLPTPYLNTSVAFYKRQLWTYNLTVNNIGQDSVNCYMWHECEGGRGANQVATCLYKELISLPSEVKRVVFYSDTCGGQNRNSHVAAMFLKIMQETEHLDTIDHKFMISGHGHLECDVVHGIIEKKKKKLEIPIYHPHDWYQLVRLAGKKTRFNVTELTHPDFLDFGDLLKNSLQLRKKDTDGEPFSWLKAKWFRYSKNYGVVQFKYTLDEEEPFKSISFIRRGQLQAVLKPKCCYQTSLAISSEKRRT